LLLNKYWRAPKNVERRVQRESRNFVGIMTPSRGPLQVAVRQRRDAQKEGSRRLVASGFED